MKTEEIGAVGAYHPRDIVLLEQPEKRRYFLPRPGQNHVIGHFRYCQGTGIVGIGDGNRPVVRGPFIADDIPHFPQEMVLSGLFYRAACGEVPGNVLFQRLHHHRGAHFGDKAALVVTFTAQVATVGNRHACIRYRDLPLRQGGK